MQHDAPVIPMSKKALSIVTAASLALTLCPGIGAQPAHADPTAAEKQAEAEETLANLNAMQETLDRLSAEYGEAVAAQEEAEASRDAAEERLDEINGQIDDLRDRLDERARDMYRAGTTSFIDMLLGASTFEEFTTSWDMLNKANANDVVMVQERKDLAEEAEHQAAVFNEQALVAAQKAQEAAEAEEQAEATVAEMQATYESLSAEAERLLEEERAAQAAAEAAAAAAVIAASAAEVGGDAEATAAAVVDGAVAAAVSDDQVYEGGSDTVSRAYACLGAPYVWGGVGPGGYDCSGLVSYCLTGSHTRLGTTYTFMNWPQVSDPQPGDIAVNSGHTGVYIGNGQMIHAATYGVGVIIGPVQSGMKIVRYGG